MAELHHILGSIFRDIAQARVTSDLYSRNISKYYEQDPLLRKFPTPRTEVEEVEVDLKFILSGFQHTMAQDEGREASTATIFTKLAKDISDGFFGIVLQAVAAFPRFSEDTGRKLKGLEHRIYLSQDLLLFFQRERGALIRDGKFDHDLALKRIHQLLQNRLMEIMGDSGLTEEDQDRVYEKAFADLELPALLKSVQDPVQQSYHGQGDIKVAVEVTVDKLAETPEAAISSIKVKARIRNYIWSKVEHEGQTWRALNPE